VADEPGATERGAHVDRPLGLVFGVEGEDDGADVARSTARRRGAGGAVGGDSGDDCAGGRGEGVGGHWWQRKGERRRLGLPLGDGG
jgi:hypothetical protein